MILCPSFRQAERKNVALAEALEATLLTRDARLARSGGHEARIELI